MIEICVHHYEFQPLLKNSDISEYFLPIGPPKAPVIIRKAPFLF